jgi:hypothetical protein
METCGIRRRWAGREQRCSRHKGEHIPGLRERPWYRYWVVED